jgi:hypothetical protein
MTLPDAPRRERLANRNFRWMMAQIPETKHQRNRDQAIPKDKRACYLKEARAMLAGTKKRYNPCTKLIGDD